MVPTFLLRIAPLVAGLRIVAATLPSGEVERAFFVDSVEGVRAVIERTDARSDSSQRSERLLKRGNYTWRIDEERRTILMATPGRRTGVVRRSYTLSAWIDISRRATDPPRPTEAFRFYAPSREAAEALKERLRKGLSR